MKRVILLLLLLLPVVQAYTLADWPQFYVSHGKFNAKYVVGEEAPALDVISATIISTSLAKFENVTTEVGTSTLDIEISDITKHNAIVLGSPCENRAAAQLMGNPVPCYKDLAGSVGYIKLFENNSKVQILITGLDEKDRNAAAKYLADKSMVNIKTNEYIVVSNSGSVPAFFELKYNKTATKNASSTAVVNVSNITAPSKPIINDTLNASAKFNVKTYGEYEPLGKLPEKKGFWASFWSWIKGLFT